MQKTLSKLVLLFFVLIVQNSLGQEKFNSDYIVNKAGDTIYGFIKYTNKQPKIIKFKDLKTEREVNYLPENIRAFKMNEAIYLSAKIETKADTNEAVFLQSLIEGDKSLYSYVGSNNEVFYSIKQNEKYIILVYKNGTNEHVENNKFKGQLLYYLSDCSTISSIVSRSLYNTVSLLNVFKKYYECKGSTPTVLTKEKIKIETGAFIGASFTTLKFDEHHSLDYLNSTYKSSTDISFGIFLDLFLSKNKNWSLYNEIQYYTYNTSNYYEDIENEYIYTTTDTKIGHSIIKLNNLIRYNFSIVNQPLYVNLGMTNGWVVAEENYRRTERNVYSVQTIIEDLAIPDVKNHEFGVIMGIGTKFNKLSFEARYEMTSGVSQDSANSKLHKFYLLLGYRI